MPQLNPTPWFMTFTTLWLLLLLTLKPKFLLLKTPQPLTHLQFKCPLHHWNWPWL